MLLYDTEKFDTYFQRNLLDWCIGGPSPTGWTRTGPIITLPALKLRTWEKSVIPVDEVLAKNRLEVEKWHLAFLQGGTPAEKTLYWIEYLMPRYTEAEADLRCKTFIRLFKSIRKEGFQTNSHIWVADLESLNLGFRYFRFDGCHRAACAKMLGIETVPAYVFSVSEDSSLDVASSAVL